MSNFHLSFFFYGTLKEDGNLHYLIEEYLLSAPIKVKAFGRLYKSPFGNWPVMVIDNKKQVYGELYQVKFEILKVIYQEELIYGYTLKLIDIYNLDGSFNTKALVCLWDNQVLKSDVIISGEWINN